MSTPGTQEQAFVIFYAIDGTVEIHVGPLFDDEHVAALVNAENALHGHQHQRHQHRSAG